MPSGRCRRSRGLRESRKKVGSRSAHFPRNSKKKTLPVRSVRRRRRGRCRRVWGIGIRIRRRLRRVRARRIRTRAIWICGLWIRSVRIRLIRVLRCGRCSRRRRCFRSCVGIGCVRVRRRAWSGLRTLRRGRIWVGAARRRLLRTRGLLGTGLTARGRTGAARCRSARSRLGNHPRRA
jgi:hypothetical protein